MLPLLLSCDADILQACRLIWTNATVRDVVWHPPCTPLHWFPFLSCNRSAKNGVTGKEWFQLKRMLSYLCTRVQLFTRVQSKRHFWMSSFSGLYPQCKVDWQGQSPCQQMKPTQKYIFVFGMKSYNTPTIVYFLYWQRIIQFMGIVTICANVM